MQVHDKTWIKDLLLLSLVIGIAYFLCLGFPPLSTPDEGRYAEMSREMLSSGNFIVPHLNGIIYFEKPPLLYWITAFSIKLFGSSEWSVRFLNAFLSECSCLFVYFAARKLFNRRTGILSALITASTLFYLFIGRMLITDVVLSFTICVSLLSFILAFHESSRLKQSLWLYLAYFAAAFAFLAKGLIGIVFPIMIIGLWILIFHRWSFLKKMRLLSGFILFFIIALPWVLVAQQEVPSFMHEFFWVQHIERYTTPVMRREMNPFAYVGVVLLGFFPWIVFIPQSIKFNCLGFWKSRNSLAVPGFLVLWAAAIFLFFGFSHSVLIPYLLPIVAPLAILTARYLDANLDKRLISASQRKSIYTVIVFYLGLAVAFPLLPKLHSMIPSDFALALLILASVISLASAALILFWLKKNQFRAILAGLFVSIVLIVNIAWLEQAYFTGRSVKALAQELQILIKQNPNAKIFSYNQYYQDLPYYLNNTVIIVNWMNELTYGYSIQADSGKYSISENEFWSEWASKQLSYAVMRNEDYPRLKTQHHLCLVKRDFQDVLVSNQKHCRSGRE